jgi:hypothetical protein
MLDVQSEIAKLRHLDFEHTLELVSRLKHKEAEHSPEGRASYEIDMAAQRHAAELWARPRRLTRSEGACDWRRLFGKRSAEYDLAPRRRSRFAVEPQWQARGVRQSTLSAFARRSAGDVCSKRANRLGVLDLGPFMVEPRIDAVGGVVSAGLRRVSPLNAGADGALPRRSFKNSTVFMPRNAG